MKTKNNSFKKAALPVVGVLAAAIVSLTSVTYAWFTYGNEATVDQIDVNVESAGGLQIAVGEEGENFNWVSNVTPNIGNNIMLTPVSTTGAYTNGAIQFFSATYDDTMDKIYNITNVSANTAENGVTKFLSFDLYFRNAEAFDKVVDLSGTTVTSASGYSNLAVRMAFVTQGTISSVAADQTPGAFTGNGGTGTATIFEPNATSHTGAGIADYEAYNGDEDNDIKYEYRALTKTSTGAYFNRYTGDMYQLAADVEDRVYDEDEPNAYEGYYVLGSIATAGEKFTEWVVDNDFNAIGAQEAADLRLQDPNTVIYTKAGEDSTYVAVSGDLTADATYYVYNPVNLYTKTAYNTVVEDEIVNDTLSEIIVTQDDSYDYIELAKQSVTKVTVYIWMEGQDADCNNTVAGYQFSVNLKFNASEQS